MAQNSYFPQRSFDQKIRNDKLQADYYTWELKLLDEASFLELSQKPASHSYRFLWLRSFNQPVMVRLDIQADDTGVLTTKIGSGRAGFQQKDHVLIENTSRTLTTMQVDEFLTKVEKVKFWQFPSYMAGDQTGTDGSDWVIEAVRGGKYHVAARWSPDSKSSSKQAVRELGLALAIDLAQMKIPADELY
ncbi:hypothetical protein [Acidicapsa ligni]|uniref:hypothetical protein n=1 Tax=Acidicapsa ligni TaxID=542300 RepID=UPI0021E0B895|nr:hypothetical protein [Acidicapsa ligni]